MQICCAGEVMVEMAVQDDGSYRRGVAGDSYNTAVYLARAGLAVNFLTRLGDDPLSDDIVQHLQHEGIGDTLVERDAGRVPGLYLIENDAHGERQFHYWRDSAPARELFARPLQIAQCDVFYFTGITLAVTHTGLAHLVALLSELRAGGCRIVFDPNYRPALWDNANQAREHYAAVLPLCDIALPTLEDDAALWNIHSVDACSAHYQNQGIAEVVIKGPALTTYVYAGDSQLVQAAPAVTALDTTGAGDAFNAGYLAARLPGGDLEAAVGQAQQLAAAVVQHRGAILPRTGHAAIS